MFSHIFLRRQSNESIPVTPQVQDDMGSQQQQGSTVPDTEVQPSNKSLKRRLEDAFILYPNKIARLKMETSSNKSWELPSRLLGFVRKYVTHHGPRKGKNSR